MNPILIVWVIFTMLTALAEYVSAVELWKVRTLPGTLYEFLFRAAKAIYEIGFGVLLIIASTRPLGATSNDLLVFWVGSYFVSGVFSVTFMLYVKGRLSEDRLRKWLRLPVQR